MKIYSIGRANADVVIADEAAGISRLHAELTVTDDGRYYLVDCGSRYGTGVRRNGGWEVIKQTWVDLNDELKLGRRLVRVKELLRMASA